MKGYPVIQLPSSQPYLVKEGHVDEAVVQNQGSLGPQQFYEQSPDVHALVIRTALIRTNSRETAINECKREVRHSAAGSAVTLSLPLRYGIPMEYCLLKSKPCWTRNWTDWGSMTYSSEHSKVRLYTWTRYVSGAWKTQDTET